MILSHWGWNPNPGPLQITQEMLAGDTTPALNPNLGTTQSGETTRSAMPPVLNTYVGDTAHGGNWYVWANLTLDPPNYVQGKSDLWVKSVIDISLTFRIGYGVLTGSLPGYPGGNLDHYFPGRSADNGARTIEVADPWLARAPWLQNGQWYASDAIWQAVHDLPAPDQILW